MNPQKELNILIISGSQRNESKSYEVSKHIQKHILNPIPAITSSILNLSEHPSLLDHYGNEQNDKTQLAKSKKEVLDQLYLSDALVFVTPEWGGMIPPAVVNLLLLSANGSAQGLPLGHKPGFIIGISASGGGNYPISLLKGYAAKNSHLIWLPLHAVVTNVNDFLHHKWSPDQDNRFSQIQSRLLTGLKSLVIYGNTLKAVRDPLVALSKVHPFGQ